jgi:hypothetical protein
LIKSEHDDSRLIVREVLTRYDELVPVLDLDGTSRFQRDAKARGGDENGKLQWAEYFDVVEKSLKEKSLREVRDTIEIPEELRILSETLAGLHGPGLGRWREIAQITFLEGPGVGYRSGPDSYVARVKELDELGRMARLYEEDWVVGGGWVIGGSEAFPAFCCAVYCRRQDVEEAFAWRYTLSDIDATYDIVFDTIPELLAWYKTFREPEPEYYREWNEDETVFDAMWC